MRSKQFNRDETKILISVFYGVSNYEKGITIAAGFMLASIGALLSILSVFGLLHPKPFNKILQLLFYIGYILGCTIIFFVAYKNHCLGVATAMIFVFFMYRFWASRISIIKVLILLTLGSLLFFYVGHNDHLSIAKRFKNFFKSFPTTIVHGIDTVKTEIIPEEIPVISEQIPIVTKIDSESTTSEKISIISKSKDTNLNSTKNETKYDFIIKNPYTLKVKPEPPKGRYYVTNRISKDARVAHFIIGLHLFLQNPILGYSSYFVVNTEGHTFLLAPHSSIVIVFISTGMIGTILFLYIIIRGIIDSFIISYSIPDMGWLSCIYLWHFVTNLFDGGLLVFFLWVPLIAMRACVKTQIKSKQLESKTI
jgi:hypothetical protein